MKHIQRVAIVDVETSGLNPNTDRILELGIILCRVDGDVGSDSFLSPIACYSGLQMTPDDFTLTAEVESLTGLTDRDVGENTLEWHFVEHLLDCAGLLIAHNAIFDRAFLARVLEICPEPIPWACSMQHIDWRAEGSTSLRLAHVAADQGFVNPFPHRALFDCATVLRLLDGRFDELVHNAFAPYVRIEATGAPFAVKDELKARGYRWNPDARVWWTKLRADERPEETNYLVGLGARPVVSDLGIGGLGEV